MERENEKERQRHAETEVRWDGRCENRETETKRDGGAMEQKAGKGGDLAVEKQREKGRSRK